MVSSILPKTEKIIILSIFSLGTQYGHSQSEKKLGLGDKYNPSIKVHMLEAQNQHTLKSRVEARVTIQKIKSLGVLQTETCH